MSVIKVEKRGWHRATGIRTTKRPRRGKWKTVTLAPPPTFPANGSGAHPKSWCQARVLISGELPTGQGHGVVRRVSASAPGCRGAGEGTWCQARVLASGGTPECPEWVWTAISQSAGNEMVRCVEYTKCRVVLRAEGAAADLGLAAKRTGWCRPCGAVVSFLRLPWVSRGDTHGYSNSIPPGCSITKRPGMPESRCGFVPEDIGGEMLMARDCPELSNGTDAEIQGLANDGPECGIPSSTLSADDREDGIAEGTRNTGGLPHDFDSFDRPEIGRKRYPVVRRKPVAKAVEGYRSPRPGGRLIGTRRLGASWDDRRRLGEDKIEFVRYPGGVGRRIMNESAGLAAKGMGRADQGSDGG